VYVNFAYDGGVHVYSSYFVLLAGFLLVDDIPRLYKSSYPGAIHGAVHFYPSFSARWLKFTRIGLKTLTIFLFLGVLFYLQLTNFLYDPYKQPAIAGIRTLKRQLCGHGIPAETNKVIPYSPLDTLGWQEVEIRKMVFPDVHGQQAHSARSLQRRRRPAAGCQQDL